MITKANSQNRKSFENQLKIAQQSRDTLSKKIDDINDSITSLDTKILDITSKEIESGELGSIKYLSEITGWNIKKTANFFILVLIFVFDPLAIALVISTNQAFITYRRKKEEESEIEVTESYFANHTPQVTPQVEPEIIERIVEVPVEVDRIIEVPVEVIKEVEKIVEVPVDRVVEVVREVPVDQMIEVVREVPVEVIKEVEKIVEVPVEIPYKYYVNDSGQIFDEEGSQIDQRLFEKKMEEIEKKLLKYKK